MHVELLVRLVGEHLVDAALAELHVDEAAHQHARGGVVVIDERGAGLHRLDGRFLRGKHELVDVLLRRGELPVHREGARDVRGIAVELAARVDQQQLALAQFRGVLPVVQHAGVGAGGDDGAVGGRARAVAAELVQEFRLDLVLALARARPRASRARAPRAEISAARRMVAISSASLKRRMSFTAARTSRISVGADTPVRTFARTALSHPATRASHAGSRSDGRVDHGLVGDELGNPRVEIRDRVRARRSRMPASRASGP